MYPFFVALHILLCLFLITIIMLQPGKGDASLTFSGGGANLFGPRGATGVLQRATTIVAVLYMGTTITLALYSNRSMLSNANVDEELKRLQEHKTEQTAPPAPSDDGMTAPVPAPETPPAPEPAPAPAP